MSQLNPIHILTHSVFMRSVLSSHLRLGIVNTLLPSGSRQQYCIYISHFFHMCYMFLLDVNVATVLRESYLREENKFQIYVKKVFKKISEPKMNE